MTFEEMQRTIEGMLSVQREIQEGQLQLKENLMALSSDIQEMRAHGREVDRRIDQLVGYSINRERDYLDIQQDILDMRRRLVSIERELEQNRSGEN